jgi:hypothetical protein
MASVPSPERPVVLRRLGIIKDPDEGALQNSRAQRDSQQDALELFATEADSSPRFGQWLTAVGTSAAATFRFTQRNPMVGLVLVGAIALVASIWGINRYFAADSAQPAQQEQVAAVPDDGAAASAEDAAASTTADRTSLRGPAAKAIAARTPANSNTGRAPQVVVRNGRENTVAAEVTPAAGASQPDRLNGFTVAVAPASVAAPPSVDAAETPIDETIYSERDPDVVPPQLAERLPGPTISRWTTRTNAMEVIVSETGTVERVKMVTPPQRMPDILELSRAKMWKFAPATKEGKPVRYRLLLTWEVNP